VSAAGPNGDLYVTIRVREDERFVRDQEDLHTVVDVPAPLAALGTDRCRCRASTARSPSRSPPARSRAR
jgi:DnaJ-class molecular chaperone